jgi:hypothetical protein
VPTEQILHVAVPPNQVEKLTLLRRQADAAAERLAHSDLGDRTELVRYEQLVSQIEEIAFEALNLGSSDTHANPESLTLSIVWPFAEGAAPMIEDLCAEVAPVATWRSSNPRASPTEATYERFVEQLESWVDPMSSEASRPPLCPSGVQNRALAEALRRFAGAESGQQHVEAPITYRDGSSARPFPLRAVQMSDREPDDGREVLRMTLLSVRHFDMDCEVDGAWLRNREISLPRAAALTDELVYQQSIQQFTLVSADEPVTLHLYQTGLEPANIGFYRALVDHHRQQRGHAVAVVPYYFAGIESESGKSLFAISESPWTIE